MENITVMGSKTRLFRAREALRAILDPSLAIPRRNRPSESAYALREPGNVERER